MSNDPEELRELKVQSELDAMTLLRRLRDETRAITDNLNLIEEGLPHLEFSHQMPDELFDLSDVLEDLQQVEQRILKTQLLVQRRAQRADADA